MRRLGTGPYEEGEENVAYVFVERTFEVPVEYDDLQRCEQAAGSCFELHKVRFIRSYLSSDKQRMLCLYEAPDAESVRMANRQGNLPFDRAWAVTIHQEPDGTEPQS
jgi:hypothetical protein